MDKNTEKLILEMPDEELENLKFSYLPGDDVLMSAAIDGDGFTKLSPMDASQERFNRKTLQDSCWKKFRLNPHVNTSVRGTAGRLAGNGFGVYSEVFEINEKIQQISTDPRNRFYSLFPKYVARAITEGELFQCLTLHTDGFVEVDFVDPTDVAGQFEEGIYWHPKKPMMPLMYHINNKYVPSIYLAYYPELINLIDASEVNTELFEEMFAEKKKFPKTGGLNKFIVSWDKGFMTKRSVSYLVTTIQWLNHYETLKKYEIDHKKSSGSYLWVFSFDNIKDFKNWILLSDEEKRNTGVAAKKVPGGSLILPPGMHCEVRNPNLTRITDQDNDILHMVSAGLNEPEDIMTGNSKGTFASVKASRGPMSDRISDEVSELENFLRYDFWRAIFFLSSSVGSFKKEYSTTECVGYKEETVKVKRPIMDVQMAEDAAKKKPKKEAPAKEQPQQPQFELVDEERISPIYKKVKREAHTLIEINFPVSENVDYEARARGLLGVKHGSVTDVLGIPKSEVAGRLGMKNYGYLRMIADTEKKKYPETIMNIDQESLQERAEAEPKIGNIKNG